MQRISKGEFSSQRAHRLLVAVPAIALLLLATAGCEPKDRRPGTWLSGSEAEGPIGDWSFVNEQMEVFVETRPWYGIPHSVTTVIASKNGNVFVPSIYETSAEFPGSKYWNRIIADNPRVRLKVGETLYAMEARPAANEAEFAEGFSALAEKYDFWRNVYEDADNQMPFVIIRLHPIPG